MGGVFRGYGNAIVGTITSPYQMYKYFRQNGVSRCSTTNLFVGGFHSFIDGLVSTDPQKFGQSFGTVLITAATVAAPFAKAPVVPGSAGQSVTMIRAMSSAEADAVSHAGGLLPTTSAFGRAGWTRVLDASDWSRTAPYFRSAPSGNYTHIAEFDMTRSGLQAAIEGADAWGHLVHAGRFNAGIAAGPRIYRIGSGPYTWP